MVGPEQPLLPGTEAPGAEFERKADEIIRQYPVSRRSAALPLLHHWQQEFGFVSQRAVEWIAEKLALKPIHLLELVTFYPMLRVRPAGKINFRVCRTLSCALAGSHDLFARIRERCGATSSAGHGMYVSPDGAYSVEFVECLAACGSAPAMMVEEEEFERATIDTVERILAKSQASRATDGVQKG
ncbi:NADH-quinone oxidoreductase subunit NuoE family protein [Methylacidimicrobium tartarophylax]|uniref:NADH-quinone oxidoreductase subunit E n=1 Tax=Methylacidimicrobium tartarophylax TaxID=1041768 RepID=A0A5E6MBE4_9BACT|nr:NAD(P)H-dependent oxidoreductase subunit E [Methylacidimicrobium tartarophylax]VVM05075.1 NADH-quinone oxidoreductase subunit E [Methylacidimicrobium tartarophylax]